MISLAILDQQIKDVLLVNGGDINIEEYPFILKDAMGLGLSQVELSRRIRNTIVPSIDWAPYQRIDKMLVEKNVLVKGNIFEDEAETMIKAVEMVLQRPQTENYIRSVIRKRAFKTREKNNAEADSFKNLWMTDEAWVKYQKEIIVVEWLGEKAHSLPEMGEISFRKPDDAKYFLRNTNYLVPNITTLTKSPSKADEYSRIIEQELDVEKRYLQVIYHLNPSLPFRVDGILSDNLQSLLSKTAGDFNFFRKVYNSYAKGHIHIWLEETDPVHAGWLKNGSTYNDFLQFLYRVDHQQPFYLDEEKFITPEQLMQKVIANASYWNRLSASVANNQLPVWFEGLGKHEWISRYVKETVKFLNSGYHSEADKKLASVQALLQIVDSSLQDPHITSDQNKIELLSVEGSRNIEHAINFQLANTGFVKAKVYLDSTLEGVGLNQDTMTFFSQENAVNNKLLLMIEALKLIKNKLYSFNIKVQTEYELLSLPVEIRVVFPKKAYYSQLIKYAIFGAVFLAMFRFLLSLITDTTSWLPDEAVGTYGSAGYLPHNYFFYFIALVVLIGSLVASVFIIRKTEKI